MKRLDGIFDLRYGHSLELNALKQVTAPNGVNFASRAMGNNGITARVLTDLTPGLSGEITVALGGNGVLSAFVQPEPFVCGRDVMILTAKDSTMTTVEKLWWCRCIWENRYRFSYGRQANRTLGALLVPSAPPSWLQGLQVPTNGGLARPDGAAVPLSSPDSWGVFEVEDLFDIASGKYVPAILKVPGATPQVTSSAKNNGVSRHLDLAPNFLGGTISVARNGSVGTAFFQPVPYFATDDVRVWSAKKGALTATQGLFVCAVIMLEKFRYSYGRKWSVKHMETTEIRLPADAAGQPDWEYMDSFMRGLPFSAAIGPASGS
ncbi:restriction endonuclease subunit S [Actinomycetaceae bacterium L2_0104]